MRKSRFPEAQIIGMFKEQESPDADGGGVPPAWPEPGDLLQAEVQIWRHGGVGGRAAAQLE